jgi:prolyl oligopeptidase
MSAYPPARRDDDATVVVGSLVVPDPYRWLEDDDDPEVRAWQEAQTALAIESIRSWAGFARLRELVAERPTDGWEQLLYEYEPPVAVGGGWLRKTQRGDHYVLELAPTPAGPGRVLVDPNAGAGSGDVSLNRFMVSPDGRLVAYWTSEHGREQEARLHLAEVATGAPLPDELPHRFDSLSAGVAWLPDGSGFYYAALDADAEAYAYCLYFHRVGGAAPREPELRLPAFSRPVVSADGRYAAVLDQLHGRPSHLRRLDGGAWKPFLPDAPGEVRGVLVGDDLVAVTAIDAPRGRLVRIPLATRHDRGTWVELVPESTAVLRAVYLRDTRLVLSELVDTCARLRVLELDGSFVNEVPLPGPGTVEPTGFTPVAEHATRHHVFPFASFTTSLAVYSYDVVSGELEQLLAPEQEIPGVRVSFERCTGADGFPVTYQLVHREDLDRSRPQPALIRGYGYTGGAWTPFYLGIVSPFLAAGGVYVHANLRGGSEHGQLFNDSGQREGKQNTFDDLYAIAEDLVARGVTTADRLGFVGESGGGATAGTAALQRPDLFRVLASRQPILDLLRMAKDRYGLMGVRELFGDPLDETDARRLLGISAYHLVREGVEYPALLFECAENDHRCPPWHSRKTAARLQAASPDGHPILLRHWVDTGHGATTGLSAHVGQTAEWLAFVMRELGLSV